MGSAVADLFTPVRKEGDLYFPAAGALTSCPFSGGTGVHIGSEERRRRLKGPGALGLLVAWVAGIAVPGDFPARAAEEIAPALPREQGPFEERNQFVFNLLFLTFPARGGSLLPRGGQEISLTQTYSNTFVFSQLLLDMTPSSDDRERLTPATLSAAHAMDPDQALYFVDGEQGRTELRCRVGVTDRFEAGIEIPFGSYRRGFLDGYIESYHRTFGMGNGGREFYEQDRTQIALVLDGSTYYAGRSPGAYVLGDVALFGRISLARRPGGDLALSAGLKLPSGDPDHLAGSGSVDEGLALEGTERRGRHRLHFSAGWIRVGKWRLFPRFDPAQVGSAQVTYEFVSRDAVSWIAQLQTQSTVFRGRTDNALAEPATEILLGLRWREAERWFFEAAFIENVFNQNTGVDVGVRFGGGVRLGRR